MAGGCWTDGFGMEMAQGGCSLGLSCESVSRMRFLLVSRPVVFNGAVSTRVAAPGALGVTFGLLLPGYSRGNIIYLFLDVSLAPIHFST